jgi:hypothetical protein
MVDVFNGGMAAVQAMQVTVVGMGVWSAHEIPGLATGKRYRSRAKMQHSIQCSHDIFR